MQTLTLTRYPATKHDRESWGLDWQDGRPAVERCFATEADARAEAARLFAAYPITRVRTWGQA